MATSFNEQRDREIYARTVMGEIDRASLDDIEKYVTANGLGLIEKMQESNCLGVTESQLDFLKIIRDRLQDKGAI